MNRWLRVSELEGNALNIAHRGASAYAPENTIIAFVLASEMGAEAIELDVHLSGNGHLVVCHDASVNRTTNGCGNIADLDLATLQTFDAGYSFSPDTGGTPFRDQGLRIPTLTDGVASVPEKMLVNVEVKATLARPWDPVLRERVSRALTSWLDDHTGLGWHERILLSSFDWQLVDEMREAAPRVATAYLVPQGVPLRDALAAAVEHGHDAMHPHESLIGHQTRTTLKEAHAGGVAVNVWTVDEPSRMRELVELGVDGIVTNRPNILTEIRQGRRRATGRNSRL